MSLPCLSTPLRFIPIPLAELCLPTVLKCGQAFRWVKLESVVATQPDEVEGVPCVKVEAGEEYAMAWKDRTVVLRQEAKGIHYRSLYPREPPHASYLADVADDTTLALVRAYFQLDTRLVPLYKSWSRDPHFKKKVDEGGTRLLGIRILSQDPWETLISFICSSNNHISRITGMINSICVNLGSPLPHPCSFHPSTVVPASAFPLPLTPSSSSPPDPLPSLYAFPPPSALCPPSTDDLLRDLGCGYRAPFILVTSLLLVQQAKDAGVTPSEYLETMRDGGKLDLDEARRQLMLYKGVGRKVADCVALFSLGWNEVIPVDTHVHQIAIRDYGFPSTKTTALTPILHNKITAFLQSKWGAHSGWLQQILFFSDLKTPPGTVKPKVKKEKEEVVKGKWEVEVEALMKAPVKRKRVAVVKKEEDEEYSISSTTLHVKVKKEQQEIDFKKVKLEVSVGGK